MLYDGQTVEEQSLEELTELFGDRRLAEAAKGGQMDAGSFTERLGNNFFSGSAPKRGPKQIKLRRSRLAMAKASRKKVAQRRRR